MRCKVDGQLYGGRALCEYLAGSVCTAPRYVQCEQKEPEKRETRKGGKRGKK